MRAGASRGFLTIQRKIIIGSTNSSAYEPNIIWTDIFPDIPCEVLVLRGKEQFDSKTHQRFSQDVWQFTTRYEELLGVSSADRVVFDGMNFDIKSQRPDAQFRESYLLECTLQDVDVESTVLTAGIDEIINQGWVGEPYSGFTVLANGGTAPYQFTTAGIAPGLLLDGSTGIVSGTPTTVGTWLASIQVIDAAGAKFSLPDFDIIVNPGV